MSGTGKAVDTPIGRLPAPDALDLIGLTVQPAALDELLRVDIDGWLAEVPLIREHFERFGDKLPDGLYQELNQLEERLQKAKH